MRFSLNNPNLILLGGEDFGVAGFEGTIWRSTDAGGSWTKVYELGDFHRTTDLEIIEDGTDQNMVAAWNSESGDNIGGALRSTDNGASWFDSSSGLPTAFFRGPRLCASPSDPQTLLISAWLSFQSGGLFRTTDGGVNWTTTGFTGNQTVGDVACHPVHVKFCRWLRTDVDHSEWTRWQPHGCQGVERDGSWFIKSAMGLEKSITTG